MLKVVNPLGRWVHVFAETNEGSRTVLDAVLVPGGSKVSLGWNFLSGTLGSEGEAEIAFPSTQQNVRISLYAGFGTGWDASDPESKLRRALPLVLTVIDSYALPIIDIIGGFSAFKHGLKLIQKRGLKGFSPLTLV